MEKTWRNLPKREYVPRSPAITSSMMSKVKNRDSKAELLLRREIWSRGFRYRLHSKHLIGKPDLAFCRQKPAVFVDGDFWHGRALIEEGVEGLRRGLRSERAEWWISKIQKTIERDEEVSHALSEKGWRILRFWESEHSEKCAEHCVGNRRMKWSNISGQNPHARI